MREREFADTGNGLQILVAFSGFLISHTPVFFKWIAKMSFVSFAYSALYQNEFDGLQMNVVATGPSSNAAGMPKPEILFSAPAF